MRVKSLLFILCLMATLCATAGTGFTLNTIVIDAGHGGKDPGAIGPGKMYEKTVALSVALKLGDLIKKSYPEVNVIYTRKTDQFIELHERADMANRKNADLFISIHCNSNNNPQAYGSSCYVLGLHRSEANLEVAKRENSVILLEDNRDRNYEFDPNTPEGHIIMSMKQNAFLDQSISIASKVENRLENDANRKSRGVKQAGFYVLYKTAMPSILAEIGFISNPDEEKFLTSDNGQTRIADALFAAFKDYKKEIEGSKEEQAAYEKAKEEEATQPQDSALIMAAKNIMAKEEKKTPQKEEVKTVTKPTVTPEKVVKPTAAADSSVVVVGGKTIRKPTGGESGGGAVAAKEPLRPKEAPIEVKKENAVPVAKQEVKTPSAVEEKKEAAPEVTVFKVQLFALKEDLKDRTKLIALFKTISTEKLSNGFTRYYGGNEKNYAGAKKLLDLAHSNGFPTAFIVGYLNGTRMTLDQLKNYMH